MKIKSRTKIICDICGKDISWTMRDFIQVKECAVYFSGKIKRHKWDICRDCAEEMKDYLKAVEDVKTMQKARGDNETY